MQARYIPFLALSALLVPHAATHVAPTICTDGCITTQRWNIATSKEPPKCPNGTSVVVSSECFKVYACPSTDGSEQPPPTPDHSPFDSTNMYDQLGGSIQGSVNPLLPGGFGVHGGANPLFPGGAGGSAAGVIPVQNPLFPGGGGIQGGVNPLLPGGGGYGLGENQNLNPQPSQPTPVQTGPGGQQQHGAAWSTSWAWGDQNIQPTPGPAGQYPQGSSWSTSWAWGNLNIPQPTQVPVGDSGGHQGGSSGYDCAHGPLGGNFHAGGSQEGFQTNTAAGNQYARSPAEGFQYSWGSQPAHGVDAAQGSPPVQGGQVAPVPYLSGKINNMFGRR